MLILNSYIFENEIKHGLLQNELFSRIKAMGANGVEVRREYFKDIDKEVLKINRARKDLKLIVHYSVPDELFLDDGQLNPKLSKYFIEGKKMGISKIKLNLGNFRKYFGNLKEDFETYPLDEIQLNIENDQTKMSGSINNLKYFLEKAKSVGLHIGYVYDLGNWAYTNQDANKAADELGKYVNYIHLKNTELTNDGFITSDDLNSGRFNWKQILHKLPNNVDIALEYPMDNDENIRKQINLVKKEVL